MKCPKPLIERRHGRRKRTQKKRKEKKGKSRREPGASFRYGRVGQLRKEKWR